MRVEIERKRQLIQVGDVVVTDKNKAYLVANVEHNNFPIVTINLSTGRKVNGYMNSDYLNENMEVISGEKIVTIIKNKNLVIKEEMQK